MGVRNDIYPQNSIPWAGALLGSINKKRGWLAVMMVVVEMMEVTVMVVMKVVVVMKYIATKVVGEW
jgi:hypothetical protein